MLNAIVVSIRFILLILGGQKQVALENAALRQQLAVFKRNVPRPKLNNRDRLFWIGLYLIWQDWKSALIFVQPETVTSWHHKRFKRYWWKLSQPKRPGRPRTRSEIRTLIHSMDGTRKSDMGSTTGTRRTKKTGVQDFGADRVALDAQEAGKAVADLDDVPSKSRWPNGLGRLLHGSDHTAPCALCIRHPRA